MIGRCQDGNRRELSFRDRARHQIRLYCVAVPDRRRVWHDARCLSEAELRGQHRKCMLGSRRGGGSELPARAVDANGASTLAAIAIPAVYRAGWNYLAEQR